MLGSVVARSRLFRVAVVVVFTLVASVVEIDLTSKPAGATTLGATPPAYDAAVRADAPVSWWPLDESGGATARDEVGPNLGYLQNDVSAGVPGPFGTGSKAMRFGGAPCDGVDVARDPGSLATQTMSVEQWLRRDDQAYGVSFRWRWFGYDVSTGPDGSAGLGGWVSSWESAGAGGGYVTDGDWHHVVGVRTVSTIDMYVDGALVKSTPAAAGMYYSGGGGVTIGRPGDACDGLYASFKGDIAQTAFYGHPLSADRILAHYCAGMPAASGCGPVVVAGAGPDQSVSEGSAVSLDATSSRQQAAASGPSGRGPLTYSWQAVSAQGPPVQLSSTTDAKPSFTAFDDGVYTFRLTVADGVDSASDDVNIAVTNQRPVVNRVDAGPTATDGLAQVTVAFNDPGPFDTHTVTYDWGDGTAPEVVAAAMAGPGWGYGFAGHVYATTGDKTVRLKVTDNNGGVSEEGAVTFNAGAAGQGEAAPGAALWASSSTAVDAIRVSGSGNKVQGLAHSNSNIRVSGSGQAFTGGTEYRTTIATSGSGNVFNPAAKQLPAAGLPYSFNLAEYQPGGRAAVAAGTRFHAVAAADCKGGKWKPKAPLASGLWYVPCGLQLSGSDLAGQVTIAATGDIQISGSGASFTPYSDGLLFLTTSTGAKAIDLSGSGHRFQGAMFSPVGGIEVTGSGNVLDCGIVAATVRISGSGNIVGGLNCVTGGSAGGTVVPIGAPPVLAAKLASSIAAAQADVYPGSTVTYRSSVTNTGATVFMPIELGVDNRGSTPVTVAGVAYRLELHDPSTGIWTTLATTDPTAPIDQRIVALSARPNAAPGVTYPAGADTITGTVVNGQALGSWAAVARIELTPAQANRLLDPARTDAIRNVASVTTTGTLVRKIARFAADPLGDLRRPPQAAITNVRVNVVASNAVPNSHNSSTDPALTSLAPGATVTVSDIATVPVPTAKGADEADAAYLFRLAALDRTTLVGAAHAAGTTGAGPLLSPQSTVRTTRHVPVVAATITAPSAVDAGTPAKWTVTVSNTGSATATGLAMTVSLGDGTVLPLTGLPAELAAGQTVTVTPQHPTPAGSTATLTGTVAVTWSHPGGPARAYGPVGGSASVLARPAVALKADKFASSGQETPAGQFQYNLSVRNTGNLPMTGIVLDDAVDSGLTIVAGSLTASRGSITSGTATTDRRVTVTVGELAPDAASTITFMVDTASAPRSATTVTNQAIVTSDQLPAVLTDDPTMPGAADPTITAIGSGGNGDTVTTGPGPVVSGCTLAEGATVTGPSSFACNLTPLAGTTTTGWRVTAVPSGAPTTETRSLATGASNAVTATFDPTVLTNGQWTITVIADGSDGGRTQATTTVVVDGNLKLGRYHVTYQDLSVVVGGIPIQVNRTYDTLDRLRSGDFGQGWNLELANFAVQTNGPVGAAGWEQYSCGGSLVFANLCYRSTRAHVVTVTWPDGHTESFDFTPQGMNTFYKVAAIPAYTAKAGATSRLEPAPGDNVAGSIGDGHIRSGGFGEGGAYDPQQLVLVGKDGTRYLLDRTAGLVSATDRNANTVIVTPDAVTSSLGPSIRFHRDTAGRITEVGAPDGSKLAYVYNPAGELSGVTDANGHTTGFAYQAGHYLTATDDPGPGVFRSLAYDAAGRLTAITDAGGHTTTVASTVTADQRQQVVASPDGRTTTITVLDGRGNQVSQDAVYADAVNGDHHQSRWTYTTDGRDQVTSRTDPAGRTWRAGYDGTGNLLSFTDPAGASTTLAYDSFGSPTSVTDPNGVPTVYTYDPAGRLVTVDAYNRDRSVDHQQRFAYDQRGDVVRWEQESTPTRVTTWEWTTEGRMASVTDGTGSTTSYGYDATGRTISTTDPAGGATRSVYDGVGNLTSSTDALGRTSSFTYDASDRMATSADPAGAVTRYGYDATGLFVSATDPLGRVTRYAYDAAGRHTSTTDAMAQVTTTTYNGAGRPMSSTDPLGQVTTFGYDLAGQRTKITAPGRGTTTNSYTVTGLTASVTDGAGQVTAFGYDASGRTVTETVNGRETTLGYDAWGNQTTVTVPDGVTTRADYTPTGDVAALTEGITAATPNGLRSSSARYDPAGRPTLAIDPLNQVTATTYDPAGRIASVTDPSGGSLRYTYDPAGQVTAITNQSGVTTAFGYDPAGRQSTVTDALGNMSTSVFDQVGQLLSGTDARGAITRYAYDSAGRNARITDALGGTVTYGYDAAGRRTTVTDANGHTRTFGYNPAGNQTSIRQPATPAIPAGAVTTSTYDNAGRLTQATDARGLAATYTYNPAGDLATETRQQPGGATTTATTTYDAVGRPASRSDNTGTTTWTYDPLGQVTSQATPQGTLAYGYDPAGRRTRLTIPAIGAAPGGDVAYGYDFNGQVASVTQPGGGPSTASTFTYRADGRVDTITRPNGISTTHGYDPAGRLLSIIDTNAAGATVASFVYTLDADGNRTSQTSTADGAPTATETYTLDPLNRLTAATTAGAGTDTWAYDPAGNRTQQTTAAGATAYAYDNAQALTSTVNPDGSTTTYTHDPNGNLTATSTGDTYTYNHDNQITASTTNGHNHTWAYNTDGIRVTADGHTELWDTNTPDGLTRLATDSTTTSTQGPNGILSTTTSAGTNYQLGDAQGSIRATTNSAGALTNTTNYTPWGQPTAGSPTANSGYGYTGEQTDPNGLLNLRARNYNPTLGTFQQTDTLQPNTTGTQGWNQHTYTNNNPTTTTDPTGHSVLFETAIIEDKDTRTVPALAPIGQDIALIFVTSTLAIGATCLVFHLCADTDENPPRPPPPLSDNCLKELTGFDATSDCRPIRRIYEENKKHRLMPYIANGKKVSRRPLGDGQAILDNSVPVSPSSPRRRGIEPSTGLTVELQRHLVQDFPHERVEYYHGYVPDGD